MYRIPKIAMQMSMVTGLLASAWIGVKADDIVYYTPDWQHGLTGSGQIIANPASGVIEDQTAGLVLTATENVLVFLR